MGHNLSIRYLSLVSRVGLLCIELLLDTGVHVCVWTCDFSSLNTISRSWVAGPLGKRVSHFLRVPQTAFLNGFTILLPVQQ